MARLATPGVYIEEKNAFPNSVAEVATAVPAFIGYTEKITKNGQSLINKPVRITSLADFVSTFGTGFQASFNIQETTSPDFHFEINGKPYQVVPDSSSRFVLYDSMRLFFANGGGICYVISVGGYYESVATTTATTTTTTATGGATDPTKEVKKTPATPAKPKVATISKKALEDGLNTLISEEEPTIIVIPEAVMLEAADCFALQQAMVMHCGYKMKSRVAILDVYNGYVPRSYDKDDVITKFREGIGNNFLSFAIAYYPWVVTSIVQNEEISFQNVSNLDVLADLLGKETKDTTADAKRADEIKNEVAKLKDPNANAESLNQTLKVISPAFKNILDKIKLQMNILPPSGGMAGIYTAVDGTRNVWKAPANVGFNSVITPTVKLTHDDQEDLNVTVTGKSINAFRSFVGEGTVVWGARTMDGNSQDWRYINVRRTILFIEQSIKYAAKAYVFEPNTNATWSLISSTISSFLGDLYRRGGLVGGTPEQAYEVQIGLGNTMTPNDILDGVMRITVKVAISRPAEFIVITFQQKMQEA